MDHCDHRGQIFKVAELLYFPSLCRPISFFYPGFSLELRVVFCQVDFWPSGENKKNARIFFCVNGAFLIFTVGGS